MKYLVVLVAGLTDKPLAEKDNKTPLQLAETPNLDALVQKGQCGPVQTIPDSLHPGNEVSGLGLFGYDPEKFKIGHAALDTIGLGIKPEADEITLCCDLITLQATHDDMVMKDYTGGNLPKEDSELLINALNEQVTDAPVTFHSGKGYHNLLVIKHPPIQERLSPPNELIGEGIRQFMPEGKEVRDLVFVMNQAQIILHNHPYNKKRTQEQKDAVNSIWLWGNGESPSLPSFQERFEKSASVITASSMIKGLARHTGIEVLDVEGATGFFNTDYAAKVNATLAELEKKDVVFLHIAAGEEVSLKGSIDDKILAIEDFDSEVVKPIAQALETQEETKLMIVVNHVSSASLMKYDRAPVPYLIYSSKADKRVSGLEKYDEQILESGKRFDTAPELIEAFLNNEI
ncbi:MAG: 2,3-bisphosphoglycerate-independent phosphoglycerate mutase [Nitrospinae bacterium]|nr:2,3-bisphosphoglycerate-independent phosphoglycerate mutase [Nitrospinota bacterium]